MVDSLAGRGRSQHGHVDFYHGRLEHSPDRPRWVATAGGLALLGCLLISAPIVAVPTTATPGAIQVRTDPRAAHAGHRPAAGGSYRRSLQAVKLPEVALTDADGSTTTTTEVLAGDKPVLLQFIFTTCPTICPVLSAIFAKTQYLLGDELDTVRLVSVTIDPEHDTPAVLNRHAEKFGAHPAWRFYTGNLLDIQALQKAFDAYEGNKMSHEPLIFLRRSADREWVRLDGLMSAENLVAEYRRLAPR